MLQDADDSNTHTHTHTATQSDLERVEVDYVSMPGWMSSIAHIKSMEDLPSKAKAYVEKLSELTGMKSE